MNQSTTVVVGLLVIAAMLLTFAMPAFGLTDSASPSATVDVNLTDANPAEIQQEYVDPTAQDDVATQDNDSVTVSFVPQEDTDIFKGTEITYDVVISGATNGISVLNLGFVFGGDAEAAFTDLSLNKSGLDNSKIVNGGSSATFETALLDNTYDAADEHTVGELTVVGYEQGTVTVNSTPDSTINDLEVAEQNVTSNASEFTVTEGIDLLGTGTPASNTTDDGLLDDITNSGDVGIADVQALFTAMDRPVVQEHADRFDFAGFDDSRVTIFDVQALFNRIQGGE